MSGERAAWLDDMRFASSVTRHVGEELTALAAHLRAVGMEALAHKLEQKGLCLDGAVEALERGIGAKVSEDLRVAEQSMDNMFRAAFAGLQGDRA